MARITLAERMAAIETHAREALNGVVVDTLTGERLTADLTVLRTVALNDGRTYRLECERPGGGEVHILWEPSL